MSGAVRVAVGFIVVSHLAIFVCDYTQWVPLIDFVTRHDGSPSDPLNLLPVELVYAAVTAMSFGTVAASFIFAFFFGLGTVQGAAATSCWFHAVWFVHMVWRWDAWRKMMHPSGGMQPEFFLFGHALWTVISLWLAALPTENTPSTKKK